MVRTQVSKGHCDLQYQNQRYQVDQPIEGNFITYSDFLFYQGRNPRQLSYRTQASAVPQERQTTYSNFGLTKSKNEYSAVITSPLFEIANKVVWISVIDLNRKIIDRLEMKLHHLSTGPFRHDHLLPNLNSRLLFDF